MCRPGVPRAEYRVDYLGPVHLPVYTYPVHHHRHPPSPCCQATLPRCRRSSRSRSNHSGQGTALSRGGKTTLGRVPLFLPGFPKVFQRCPKGVPRVTFLVIPGLFLRYYYWCPDGLFCHIPLKELSKSGPESDKTVIFLVLRVKNSQECGLDAALGPGLGSLGIRVRFLPKNRVDSGLLHSCQNRHFKPA